MDRKHIIRFLKERKRGAYTLLVRMYADLVTSMPVTMALELIKEDLAQESGESVDVHYDSLAKAVARYKRKQGPQTGTTRKWDFKDDHEIKKSQSRAGEFYVRETKVRDVQ